MSRVVTRPLAISVILSLALLAALAAWPAPGAVRARTDAGPQSSAPLAPGVGPVPIGPPASSPFMPMPDETVPLRSRLDVLLHDSGVGTDQTQSICAVEEGEDPFEVVDAFVQQEMAGNGFPGAQIAIAVDGEVVHTSGFGLKHRDQPDPVDENTQFRIGSVTKMMTAAAVMQQVDADQVDLGLPVQHFVPEFEMADPRAAADMTVWNLLTHSTGIPDLFTGFEMDGPKTPEALSEWAGSLGYAPVHAPPSSFWNYSNPNFSLAGLVAERASNETYNNYMVDRLWKPAGMTSTVLLPDDVLARGNYTYGHTNDLSTGEPVIHAPDAYDNRAFGPAGYAFSTTSDMVRFASLLMAGGGDVLSADSTAAMQKMHISQDTVPGMGYGYGIMLEPYNDLLLRHHGGNVLGWGAYLLWAPEHRFAVATVNNADGNLTGSLVCALEAVTGEPLPEPQDLTTDPSEWEVYAGDYSVVDNMFRRIYGWDNRWEYNAEVTLETTDVTPTLRISLPEVPDFMNPTTSFSRTLEQAALGTFYLDANLDGRLDAAWSATFIDDPDGGDETRWMRNRMFVGTRYVRAAPGLYMPALHRGFAR